MGKQIYITEKELEFLDYAIPMYKELHEDSWKDGICSHEEKIVEKLIKKFALYTK